MTNDALTSIASPSPVLSLKTAPDRPFQPEASQKGLGFEEAVSRAKNRLRGKGAERATVGETSNANAQGKRNVDDGDSKDDARAIDESALELVLDAGLLPESAPTASGSLLVPDADAGETMAHETNAGVAAARTQPVDGDQLPQKGAESLGTSISFERETVLGLPAGGAQRELEGPSNRHTRLANDLRQLRLALAERATGLAVEPPKDADPDLGAGLTQRLGAKTHVESGAVLETLARTTRQEHVTPAAELPAAQGATLDSAAKNRGIEDSPELPHGPPPASLDRGPSGSAAILGNPSGTPTGAAAPPIPAAASPLLGVPAATTPHELTARVLDQVRVALHPVRPEITLALEPPELGRLQIRLEIVQGELHAKIAAESAQVARRLEADLPHLYQTLEQVGVRVSHVELINRTAPSPESDFPESTESFRDHQTAREHRERSAEAESAVNNERSLRTTRGPTKSAISGREATLDLLI